jgi:hypothetical protein
MFSLKNFICDVKDVPSDWIFENYLQLPESLNGQRVRLNSIFNPHDRDPSMYIYFNIDSNCYKFKCFSTGKGGTAIELMMHMWKTDYASTVNTIMKDYSNYLNGGKTVIKKDFQTSHWIISDYATREWNTNDAKYWLQYNIGSDLLNKYNVVPIASYTMCKKIDDNLTDELFSVAKGNVYGYFNGNNELYKLYQPLNSKKKFLKLGQHVQGIDQLEGKKFLIITSSLKDCMAIKSIPGLNVDVIAPDSENTKLSDKMINRFKSEYSAVVTYMDSDKAGIDSMQYYLDRFNIPFCYVPLSKDFSDMIKDYGIKKAAYTFIPILDKAIAKYNVLNEIIL